MICICVVVEKGSDDVVVDVRFDVCLWFIRRYDFFVIFVCVSVV